MDRLIRKIANELSVEEQTEYFALLQYLNREWSGCQDDQHAR